MKRLILGVAGALMLGAGQAAADGLPSRGTVRGPDVAAPAWTGFYLGAGIGAGAQDVGVNSVVDFGGDGIFGTALIGYDRALGSRWVAGVFADYDFSGISGDSLAGNGATVSLDHNYSWSVGGRLGMLVTPTTLLYGTGGYTQAEFEVAGAVSETFDGYFVGAGMETFLRDNWTLKLEYRYADFGESELAGGDVDPSLHTARVVLSYKFGHRY
jgi:outer membrane immunogenic protein